MNFKRHFLALAGALVLAMIVQRVPLGEQWPLLKFGLYGALHALCVVLALDGQPPARDRALLIAGAALANVGVLYLGMAALALLSALPSTVQLFGTLGSGALCGGLAYGLLLRALLFRSLTMRHIAQLALGCLAVSLLIAAAGVLHGPADLLWLIGAWWLACSSGLWLMERRFHALGSQAHA